MIDMPMICSVDLRGRIQPVLSDALLAMQSPFHDYDGWGEWSLGDSEDACLVAVHASQGSVKIHHHARLDGRKTSLWLALPETMDEHDPEGIATVMEQARRICARSISPQDPAAATLTHGLHALAFDMAVEHASRRTPMDGVKLVCGLQRPAVAFLNAFERVGGRTRPRLRSESPAWDSALESSPFRHAVATVINSDEGSITINIAGAVAEVASEDVTAFDMLRRLPLIPPSLRS